MTASLSFLPYVFVALIYLIVAADHWRHVRSGAALSNQNLRWHGIFIAIALVVHGHLLNTAIFSAGLNLGLSNALSAIFWLTVLIYWVTDAKQRLHILQAFVLPPAAAAVIIQYAFPESHVLPYANEPLFKAHLIIAMLAYSLFTFAALHALLMATAERNLHQKTSLIRLPDFPPIMAMETLLFRVIGIGFVLLSFTLLSGMLFSEQIFHQALKFNHKNIFTILSWLIFGGLLLGRQLNGWRGKTAIRWTLAGFVLLLLAYVGSKFVLEIILRR